MYAAKVTLGGCIGYSLGTMISNANSAFSYGESFGPKISLEKSGYINYPFDYSAKELPSIQPFHSNKLSSSFGTSLMNVESSDLL